MCGLASCGFMMCTKFNVILLASLRIVFFLFSGWQVDWGLRCGEKETSKGSSNSQRGRREGGGGKKG